MRRGPRLVARLFWASALAMATATWADDVKIPVQVDVVYASTKAGAVDESLKKMQSTLAAKTRYLTLTLLSTQRVELEAREHSLTLPNRSSATLKLEALKKGMATVRVKVASADSTSTLGRERSLYVHAGSHDGGDLWLVLSQPP
jgi:hypothetical protein